MFSYLYKSSRFWRNHNSSLQLHRLNYWNNLITYKANCLQQNKAKNKINFEALKNNKSKFELSISSHFFLEADTFLKLTYPRISILTKGTVFCMSRIQDKPACPFKNNDTHLTYTYIRKPIYKYTAVW